MARKLQESERERERCSLVEWAVHVSVALSGFDRGATRECSPARVSVHHYTLFDDCRSSSSLLEAALMLVRNLPVIFRGHFISLSVTPSHAHIHVFR